MTNEARVTAEMDEATRVVELEADNRRLRFLLEQRGAPSELRHRLRSTLAMLRTIIQRSAETGRDLPQYVAHLQDRLDALARAQIAADEHGSVDLAKLLADELLHYGAAESDRIVLSGPDIALTPRVGQVFAIAIHELVVNALEHGALDAQAGRIDVAWRVDMRDDAPWLFLTWAESEVAGAAAPSAQGFGTEVLTRMLPYELKAETSLTMTSHGMTFELACAFTAQTGNLA